jgi:hypothetical protein
MNLLLKYPTKGRPEKFKQTLKKYLECIEYDNVRIVVTINKDDDLSRAALLEVVLNTKMPEGCQVFSDQVEIKSKVEAVNHGVKELADWFDVVCVISDDMIPTKGFDKVIIDRMQKYYPDTDGALFFNDGYMKDELCTLSVMGKKYFNRFGYIYHPEYVSLFCDDEFTQVGRLLNRMIYIDKVIIKHEHYFHNKSIPNDQLYAYNNSFYQRDKVIFNNRKQRNFDL